MEVNQLKVEMAIAVRDKDYKKCQELNEKFREILVSRGMTETKVFGWVTKTEREWLQEKLAEAGYMPLDQLEGTPAYTATRTLKGGGSTEITVIDPLVTRFWEMRRAREAREENYLTVLEMFS